MNRYHVWLVWHVTWFVITGATPPQFGMLQEWYCKIQGKASVGVEVGVLHWHFYCQEMCHLFEKYSVTDSFGDCMLPLLSDVPYTAQFIEAHCAKVPTPIGSGYIWTQCMARCTERPNCAITQQFNEKHRLIRAKAADEGLQHYVLSFPVLRADVSCDRETLPISCRSWDCCDGTNGPCTLLYLCTLMCMGCVWLQCGQHMGAYYYSTKAKKQDWNNGFQREIDKYQVPGRLLLCWNARFYPLTGTH